MSNIYIQEPPTDGKVLLTTTAGQFDIELWSKEAPRACRNFVQLILEGYYNGTIFHRCIPGFIVQGGDPAGTGEGGVSIYGNTFKDEFHSRLRFVRRGLVAMANSGPNDNGSQFFFTLGNNCQELQNKNTIFGKITGDTFYNLSRFEKGEFGKDDRPEYPFKITGGEILKNPYNDIIPRLKIENEIISDSKHKRKGTKNFKLLSFGDEAEEDEEDVVVATKIMSKKGNSAHDIAEDPSLSSQVEQNQRERENTIKGLQEKMKTSNMKKNALEKEEMDSQKELSEADKEKNKSRSEIRAQIRQLRKELHEKVSDASSDGDGDGDADADGSDREIPKKKKTKVTNSLVEQYEADKARYVEDKKKLAPKGTSRESQTLALLKRFSQKVKTVADDGEGSPAGDSDDNNDNWLNHRLVFEGSLPVLAKDASTKDDMWYDDITDPRNALNKRRREKK